MNRTLVKPSRACDRAVSGRVVFFLIEEGQERTGGLVALPRFSTRQLLSNGLLASEYDPLARYPSFVAVSTPRLDDTMGPPKTDKSFTSDIKWDGSVITRHALHFRPALQK